MSKQLKINSYHRRRSTKYHKDISKTHNMPTRAMAELRRSCSDFWKTVQQHRIKCDKAARKELLQYQNSINGDSLRVEYPSDAPYAVVIVDRSRRMNPLSQEKVLSSLLPSRMSKRFDVAVQKSWG
jgi:hypothetical protein